MTCTLTAVPYAAQDATTRYNTLLNPEVQGTGSWGYYAGGGTGTLTAQAIGGAVVGPPEVRGLLGRLWYQQGTAATAAVNVTLAAGPGIVAAGSTATVSAYVRTSVAQQVRLVIDWRNASNANVGYTSGAYTATPAAGAFTRLFATGVAPASATTYVLTVQIGTTGSFLATGQWVHVAAPLGDSGAELRPYFSGATANTPGVIYAWSGTAHASVSYQSVRTPIAALAVQSIPVLVLDYSAPRESASVAHRVIGRADPVHALGPLRTREGTVQFFYATAAEADAAVRLHEVASRVMLRDSDDPTLDMYYVPRRVERAPTSERTAVDRWIVSVDYTEVYGTSEAY